MHDITAKVPDIARRTSKPEEIPDVPDGGWI
jgi:hypothetical protein